MYRDNFWGAVQDLALASKDSAGIIRALTETYMFKLKGTTLSCSVRWGVTRFPYSDKIPMYVDKWARACMSIMEQYGRLMNE